MTERTKTFVNILSESFIRRQLKHKLIVGRPWYEIQDTSCIIMMWAIQIGAPLLTSVHSKVVSPTAHFKQILNALWNKPVQAGYEILQSTIDVELCPGITYECIFYVHGRFLPGKYILPCIWCGLTAPYIQAAAKTNQKKHWVQFKIVKPAAITQVELLLHNLLPLLRDARNAAMFRVPPPPRPDASKIMFSIASLSKLSKPSHDIAIVRH